MNVISTKLKHNTNCCVPQCHSIASKHPHLTFHQFPGENDRTWVRNSHNVKVIVERRQEWILRLRIGKDISRRMVVCSKHFRKEDFFQGPGKEGKNRERARLKRTALPSLFLPISCSNKNEKTVEEKKKVQKIHDRNINLLRWKKQHSDMKKNRSEKKDGADALLLLSGGDSLTDPPSQKSLLKESTNNILTSPTSGEDFESQSTSVPVDDKRIEKSNELSDDVTLSEQKFNEKCFPKNPDNSSLDVKRTNSTASTQTEVKSCKRTKKNVLSIFKDDTDSEFNTDSEEITFMEIDSSDSEEISKEKYRVLSENYKKSQKKLKEYQRLCRLYVKEVTALREVITNLKQINSITDENYF